MNINLIWAQDANGGIGKNNSLPWHISADLINFKKLTLHHTVIMGRKTWDSLPKKPLPNRRNIVLTSKKISDVETYDSIDSCLNSLKADNINDIFIIGGQMIYDAFFEHANILHITLIEQSVPDIDTFFPVSIDEIKKTHQINLKIKLADGCTYTKWEKI